MKLYKISKTIATLLYNVNTLDDLIKNQDITLLHDGTVLATLDAPVKGAELITNASITGTLSTDNQFVYVGLMPTARHGVGSWHDGIDRIIEPVMLFYNSSIKHAKSLKMTYKQKTVLHTDNKGDVYFV